MLRVLTTLTSLSLLFSFLLQPSVIGAHGEEIPTEPEEVAEEVNSFELFWPMVAGKTMDDGMVYNLKLLKEKIRGWFIFGAFQKADYQVFLATKRALEAEALLDKEKDELAIKTLGRASTQLLAAQSSLKRANEEGVTGDASQIRNRVENIVKLVSWLSAKEEGEVHTSLEEVRGEASRLLDLL